MGEVAQDVAADVNVLELAFVNTDWLFRRVESIRMQDEGTTTVRVSLDLSTRVRELPLGPTGGRVIPLAVAAKGPISRLDVVAPGCAVSVLTTSQNANMVADALVKMADGVIDEPDRLRKEFIELGVQRPPDANDVHERLVAALKSPPPRDIDRYELWRLILEQLIDSYVLIVELHGDLPARLTVKYSYDASQDSVLDADVRRNRLNWSLGTYAMANSSHVEVEVPHPLVIDYSEIREARGTEEATVTRCDEPSVIHHLVAVPTEAMTSATWHSTIRVVESTATRIAVAASTATAVLCAYLFVGTWGMKLAGGVSLALEPSASLLLAVAGVMGPFVGRAPRHWLVAKFVKPYRDITTGSGAILFATALVIGTVAHDGLRELLQAVLLSLALALVLVALSFGSRVSGRHRLKVKGRRTR